MKISTGCALEVVSGVNTSIALSWPIFDVAFDLDALIRFLLLQRRVEVGRLGKIDDGTDLDRLPDDVGRLSDLPGSCSHAVPSKTNTAATALFNDDLRTLL